MIADLILKYILTPERLFGLVWDILPVVAMCLIFTAWKEKWWKCLIPFYGTYIIYKQAWQKKKWLFFVKLLFDFAGARSVSYVRKHLTSNIWHTIKTYLETQQIAIEISPEVLITCLVISTVTSVVVFILTRVTYIKVCESLKLPAWWLKVGAFILPEIFLLVAYVWWRKNAGSKAQISADVINN